MRKSPISHCFLILQETMVPSFRASQEFKPWLEVDLISWLVLKVVTIVSWFGENRRSLECKGTKLILVLLY